MTDKQRKITLYTLLGILAVTLAACAGFDIGDVIQVKTPREVQQRYGLQARTSLNEASSEYEAWLEDVQRTGADWRHSIEKGEEIRSMLNELTLHGLDQIGPSVMGVPLLGPLLPFGAGMAGLFVGQRRLRKEKESSFKAGIREGTEVKTPTEV
tara:strand:+ start:3719 stop:4180 length:462 start_codon:yes stop_codon:yes gene_type:complete